MNNEESGMNREQRTINNEQRAGSRFWCLLTVRDIVLLVFGRKNLLIAVCCLLLTACENPFLPQKPDSGNNNRDGGSPTPVITITAHPQDATVTAGSISGSLTAAASVTEGAALSYQWYSSASNQHEHGSAIQGETGTSFEIPTDLEPGYHYYFCEVSATGGAISVRSNAAIVTVEFPVPVITITAHPQDATVTAGSISGSLIVAASVTEGAVLSYQWYSSASDQHEHGSTIQGETDASFDIPVDLEPGYHYYFCEVGATGGAESVHSDTAMVTVEDDPILLHLSGNITITVGGNPITGQIIAGTVLTASYSGIETVTYQWNRDGLHISGVNATNKTYTAAIAGDYTVTVNAAGYNPLTSDAVTAYEQGDSTINIFFDMGPSPNIGNLIAGIQQVGGNIVIIGNSGFQLYAWRIDAVTLPGENASTLVLPVSQYAGKSIMITANFNLGFWYSQTISLTILRR